MGKAQYRKKIRSARQAASGAPLGRPAGGPHKENGAPELVNGASASASAPRTREETIAVLEKINSDNPLDRLWSLAAVANLVTSSASTRRLLLSKNLVTLLLTRLSSDLAPLPALTSKDAAVAEEERSANREDCMVEATGALSNLAIEGGHEVCGEMFNKGCLKSLAALLEAMLGQLAEDPAVTVAEAGKVGVKKAAELARARAKLWVLAENVVTVLSCLVETSQKAHTGVVGLPHLLPFLFQILHLVSQPSESSATKSPKKAAPASRIPSSLAVAAAQCLLRLTEGSSSNLGTLITSVSSDSPSPLGPLFAIVEIPVAPDSFATQEEREERELLRIIVSGTLQNLWTHSRSSPSADSQLASIDRTLPDLLLSHLASSPSLLSLVETASAAFSALPSQPTSDLALAQSSALGTSQAEVELESVERKLTMLQMALEVLGEWCAGVDGLGDADEADREDDFEFAEADEWKGIPDEDMDAEAPSANGHAADDVEMDVEAPLANGNDGSDASGFDEDDMADVIGKSSDPGQANGAGVSSGIAVFAKLVPLLVSLAIPTPVSFQKHVPSGSPNGTTIPAATTASDVTPTIPVPQPVATSLAAIHVRAVEALNNLLITLGRLDETSGPASSVLEGFATSQTAALQAAWERLFGVVDGLKEDLKSEAGRTKAEKGKRKASAAVAPEEELLLAAVTTIWTLARLFAAGPPEAAVIIVGAKESVCLCEVLEGATSGNEEIAGRTVEALGCLARRKGVSVEENEAIGTLLLSCVAQHKSGLAPSAVVSALDSLFDVYADENSSYDAPVFRAKGFLQAFVDAAPAIKVMTKAIDKRKDQAGRSRAEGALANLHAFIKYRKALGF